jgi:hypothetical protein
MKRKQLTLALLAILFTGVAVHAQDKPAAEKPAVEKPAAEKRPPVPVTVTVVFNEFEGEKKISALPYTLPINAEFRPSLGGNYSQLRMGVRVPLRTSNNPNAVQQVQYMDVGTNIDCRARALDVGQYEVELRVDRSSIYSALSEGKQVEWKPNEELSIALQPIVRSYNSSMTFLMRDGQTIQRSLATDPLSGRVLKVDVTLNVVK